jgi:hypothetical protein
VSGSNGSAAIESAIGDGGVEPSAFADRPDWRVDILARRNRVTVTAGSVVSADSD